MACHYCGLNDSSCCMHCIRDSSAFKWAWQCQKLPFLVWESQPISYMVPWARANQPPNASRLVQPFFHGSVTWQTDRHRQYILLRMIVCICCVRFSFSVLLQEIGWEECLWNDWFCVRWDVKPCLSQCGPNSNTQCIFILVGHVPLNSVIVVCFRELLQSVDTVTTWQYHVTTFIPFHISYLARVGRRCRSFLRGDRVKTVLHYDWRNVNMLFVHVKKTCCDRFELYEVSGNVNELGLLNKCIN